MKYNSKIIFSGIIVLFSIIQLGIFMCEYIMKVRDLQSNPLIPQMLTGYLGNFYLKMSAGYIFLLLLNMYYLFGRRNFKAVAALSLVALIILRFFFGDIINYFQE